MAGGWTLADIIKNSQNHAKKNKKKPKKKSGGPDWSVGNIRKQNKRLNKKPLPKADWKTVHKPRPNKKKSGTPDWSVKNIRKQMKRINADKHWEPDWKTDYNTVHKPRSDAQVRQEKAQKRAAAVARRKAAAAQHRHNVKIDAYEDRVRAWNKSVGNNTWQKFPGGNPGKWNPNKNYGSGGTGKFKWKPPKGGGGRGNGGGGGRPPKPIKYQAPPKMKKDNSEFKYRPSKVGSTKIGLGALEGNLHIKAGKIVQSDIDAAVRILENEKKKRAGDRDFDIAKLETLLKRSKGDLNHVFGEVKENTDIQNKRINDRYAAGKKEVSDTYKGLQSKLSTDSAANEKEGMAELARLGIQRAGLGNFKGDAEFSKGQAAVDAASANANMQASATAAAQTGGMLSSMGSSSLQSAMGRSINANEAGINDANNAYRQDAATIDNEVRAQHLGKGGAVQKLWAEMDNNRFSRQDANRSAALAQRGQNQAQRSQQFSEFSSNRDNRLQQQAQAFSQFSDNRSARLAQQAQNYSQHAQTRSANLAARSQAFSEHSQQQNFNLSVSQFNSDNLWKAAAQRQEAHRQAALRRQQTAAMNGHP